MMRSIRLTAMSLSFGLWSAIAVAAPAGELVSPTFSVGGAAAVSAKYSTYLASVPGMSLVGATVGRITILEFTVNGQCPSDGCYTAVVTPLSDGEFRQVFSQRTSAVQYYKTDSAYPVLHVNGVDWAYTYSSGYIADLKSAGQAFVPGDRPLGATKVSLDKALHESGWPNKLPYRIKEISPTGEAPRTILVVPDETTQPGQEDCAGDGCHVWFLVWKNGAWVGTTGTKGTGLLGLLPPDATGTTEIGVAEPAGFDIYSWDNKALLWKKSGSTFDVGAH